MTALNRRARCVGAVVLSLAACGCGGGGGATGAAVPVTTNPNVTITVTATHGGQVTSVPPGVSCGSICAAPFAAGTGVTLTAEAAVSYAFERWSGSCSGVDASCALTASQDMAVGVSFISTGSTAGGPVVAYTDALSGPIAGGESGRGSYLSIFGSNFGLPSGLGTTTKVYVGAVEVANYRYLGSAKVGAKLGLQQLTVQVGNLGGAALGVALPVKVVVNGVASNVDRTFTPSAGRILFVSLTGNDSTAVAGDIARPWRYLQNESARSGAYFALGAGDHIVIRGGNWSDANGWDGTWMRAAMGSSARNGTAAAWIHITAYPGPINGNAIEDVHYTTPAGQSGGIAGPWSAIAGTSGEYFSVSNLRMDVNAAAASDAAPINLQSSGGHWRIVNNELGPWPVAGVSAAKAGGVAGRGDDVKVLGNHIHHIGGTSALENHGIYADTLASNWELAYNWVHDITGGSLLQFNDSSGGAGTATMAHGGIWPGFTGMRVHNNWIESAAKYGLVIGDAGANAGRVEMQAWNNVIIGTKLPPVRMNSSATTMDITFAYNTIHNAMVSNSGTGNGYFRNESNGSGSIRVYNNVLSQGPATVSGTLWFYDYSGQSSGWSFKNNLYWDSGRGVPAMTSDTTRVSSDPLFTNSASGNLSLLPGSPAVDRALQPIPFTILNDLTMRTVRPNGAANDIGAFELAAP